jgi:hypothetical protein
MDLMVWGGYPAAVAALVPVAVGSAVVAVDGMGVLLAATGAVLKLALIAFKDCWMDWKSRADAALGALAEPDFPCNRLELLAFGLSPTGPVVLMRMFMVNLDGSG